MHRIALAITRGANAGINFPRDPSGDSAPRSFVFEEAFAPIWDESILEGTDSWDAIPKWWRMARELQYHDAEYDAIVSWGEKLSLAMMMRHRRSSSERPHIAMMYQFEKPNIRVPLNICKKNLHAVVTWSSVQRNALIQRIRFPRERVYLVRHYVDQLFYRPRGAIEEDMFCAVGAEMRDYATLLDATRGAGYRCHIATDHVRIPGRLRLLADRRVPIESLNAQADPQITAGRMSLEELRHLYARSKFVVVPLLPSDTDNGITCILEAMAMGKPVICSRTRGQVDAVQEGVTGLYVPIGDAAALRRAISSLWNEPARAREMGKNARDYIEKHHSLEGFTSAVRSAVEASLDGRPAPDTWWGQ
ncbi:MAG TPA: glycosyltransferase family 4 protein [Steroidobacteraceae bacterium]|nr:glycosyltransferase family 4 protein [Steroidobacteraceae bacterium]